MQEFGKLALTSLAVFLLVLFAGAAMVPQSTQAAFGEADAFCNTACQPFWQKKPKQPCTLSCQDTTNSGVTTGKCNPMPPGKCIGTGFNTTGGDTKGVGGLDKFMEQIFGKLLEQLMKGGQSGGGSGQQSGGSGSTPNTSYPTCVRNTATNTVSPIPCTETNGSINYGGSTTANSGAGTLGGSTSDILLNALNGGSGETGTSTNANANSNTNTTNTTSGTETATTSTQSTILIQGAQGGVQPSTQLSQQQGMLQGDIVVGGSGGMLYVRSRDPQSNTEVAGFYGGSTMGQQQSSSLIGRMCGTRPWAQGLLGGLIAPTFFDGLCQRFGYQVGVIPVTSGGAATTTRKPTITITQQPVPTPNTSPTPLQPEVDIWANPSSVRLGARTYIFWNTRDVESCTQSGPSFSHNTLSGGASTVPLSDASTFTIECKTKDGQTVTDSARVNLAL